MSFDKMKKPYLVCFSEMGNLLDIGEEWMYIYSDGRVQYVNKLEHPAMPLSFMYKAGWTPAISEEQEQELNNWYEKTVENKKSKDIESDF